MVAGRDEQLKAREDFLRLMSHEIRTPLNGVIGMLGLLSRTRMDGAQRAYTAAARESAEHLLGLVNELLDFARIEAGKLELVTATVDLERLLQGVAELLSPKAHEKGIEIAWTVAADAPDVIADDGRIRQILFNLAGNAVKFTEKGGVAIAVEPSGAPAPDGFAALRFLVGDTGPGVPAEAHARIFEEFGHAKPVDAVRHGGAGLGLAVVKRLAEAMGGKVGLESTPGKGSTFWFEATFPLAETETREQPLKGLTIAVASPSALVREAAARQIEASGGEACTFRSLEAAQAKAPPEAVVLVDHALAPPGGLAPSPGDRQALVLIRPEDRELIEKHRSNGYDGYLIKPLRRGSLAERVLAVLNQMPALEPGGAASEDERVAPATIVGCRVLLAEDNPVNALLAKTLLRREGCTVESAGSGQEVLEAMTRSRYDVVLMDMRMPGMDGLEATRMLRARRDDTPILAFTANAFEEDRRACLAAGMNDFVSKPVDVAELRAAVARWTNRPMQTKLAS